MHNSYFTKSRLLNFGIMRSLLILLIILLFRPNTSLADNLNSDEKAILSYLDNVRDDEINFLEKVVNINSGTMNHDGVRAVGLEFSKELKAIGFKSNWVNSPEGLNRAGHLLARRQGSIGQKLLLLGHIDTVFEQDSPFQKFEREGDVAKGPGINDMKSGDVVLLFALKALSAVGALDGRTISVFLTGDEERPGRPFSLSRRDMISEGKTHDAALSFEGGGLDTAVIARRGAVNWSLKVTGYRAHSGQIFKDAVGAGAIFEASRILNSFYEEVKGEQYVTFNPGMIVGGTKVESISEKASGTAFGKTNVVAGEVVVEGGIRTLTLNQLNRTKAKMEEIVKRNLPKTSASITFDEGYPPMSPTEGNMVLFEILKKINQDLTYPELKAFDPGARGGGDVSFVSPYVNSIDGLGGTGSGAHGLSEDLNLESLNLMTKRAALLIYRLTREQ
ncbi:MAG: M20/M25/M40 family metallo-hydrolase [Sphingomonadales bacterium]